MARPCLFLVICALVCATLFSACGVSRQKGPSAPQASPSSAPAAGAKVDQTTGEAPPAALTADGISYYPSAERALAPGDSEPILTAWQYLGTRFEDAQVLYGLLIVDVTLADRRLPRGTRVAVLGSTDWQSTDEGHRKHYTVKAQVPGEVAQASPNAPSSQAPLTVEGTVDSSSCILVLTESGEISTGIIERKIGIAGGESEFNILAVVQGSDILLVDTSTYVFEDSFHPSGVRGLAIEDVNSDGVDELVLEAETIVSFNYLGATPLRWECWLKPGSWDHPIFKYNISFATDEGYSYVATRRALDSDGDGFKETVKVTTDQQEIKDEKEFANTTVSFSLWTGSEYQKDADQDLPRQATVTADSVELRAEPGPQSALVRAVPRGSLLFAFDRSDSPQILDTMASYWYEAVTKDGEEGWAHGGGLALAWIDPLKVNKETFIRKTQ